MLEPYDKRLILSSAKRWLPVTQRINLQYIVSMGENNMFAGLIICSTGLELDVKEQVRKIVVACGGHFDDDLDPDLTTHLIAEVVGSLKHRAAVAHGLSVALPRWVFDSFQAQKLLSVESFALKLLEGLDICTSGLTIEEKETVAQLVTTHGGHYNDTFELGVTNILIARQPHGAKYEAAVTYDVPVVHLGWLDACVERSMIVEEEEFALTEHSSALPTYIAMSQEIDDTQELVAAFMDIVQKWPNQKNYGNPKDSYMELFDGCILYLVGFPSQLHTLLQRVLRIGMGTIYHDMVIHQVTHIIGSTSLHERKTLEAMRAHAMAANAFDTVSFVSARWVIDSIKCQTLQPEELYPIAFHPHSVLNAKTVLNTQQIEDDPITSVNKTQTTTQAPLETLVPIKQKTDPINPLFPGYAFLLLCRDPNDTFVIQPLLEKLRGPQSKAEALALAAIDFAHIDPTHFVFITHAVVCTGAVFNEPAARTMQDQIHHLQRHLRSTQCHVTHKSDKLSQSSQQRMLQFVSDLWVHCSLTAHTKLSFASHELFHVSALRPRALFTCILPIAGFQDVIASTSVYLDVEKLVVMELLRLAGARVTRRLSPHNTHLVCRKPIGMKFAKAIEWGLHVVTARWVVASLLHGKRLSEDLPELQLGHQN
ncbi:hypothetical protein CCR75_002448 [Bremia lactucae]|uniref:BRCT domain-containing protein n=1 Tax=Bremia lactucae TaxID=4779 RepID=A0A976ICJ1_BRELC|nr:hypothetical protein CCR75_002448 [Bremia lactucae]